MDTEHEIKRLQIEIETVRGALGALAQQIVDEARERTSRRSMEYKTAMSIAEVNEICREHPGSYLSHVFGYAAAVDEDRNKHHADTTYSHMYIVAINP